MAHLAVHRLRRLSILDLSILDDVGSDRRTTASAIGVAVGSTVLLSIGGWLWWLTSGLGDASAVLVKTVVIGSLFSLVLWMGWLVIAFMILQRLTGAVIRVEQMVRSAGLAAAPLALGILMAVPGIAFGIGLAAVGLWALNTNAAIEHATGIQGRPVLIANGAGFAFWAIGISMLATQANQIAPGPFLADSIWDAVASYDQARVMIDR